MKLSFLLLVVIVVSFVSGEPKLRGRVKKRNTVHRRYRDTLPLCPFNTTIVEDTECLLNTISASKYIFTGKVLNVKKIGKRDLQSGKRKYLYKVYIRRVLKGDLSDLSDRVHFDSKNSKRFTGATVLVEREKAHERCMPAPRVRYSAIFLGEEDNGDYFEDDDYQGDAPKRGLRLLVDPVPLTLYHLDRVNAAVKENMTRNVELSFHRKLVNYWLKSGDY